MLKGKAAGLAAAFACMVVAATPAAAETLNADFAVCRNRTYVDQVIRASIDGNVAAIDRLLAKDLCRGTRGGEQVRVIGRSNPYVTVVFPGSKQRWITVTEALQ